MSRAGKQLSLRRLRKIGIVAGVAAVAVAAVGVGFRTVGEASLARTTKAEAMPTVSIVVPKRGTKDQTLALPGDIQAYFEAPIYARVSGYLKEWHFDFGAHVEKGQLLAEIDAPDLDAQLAAAQAKLNSAEAQVNVRDAERNFAERSSGAVPPAAMIPGPRDEIVQVFLV